MANKKKKRKVKYYVHYLVWTEKGYVPAVDASDTRFEAESWKRSMIRLDKQRAIREREKLKKELLKAGYTKTYVNKLKLRKPRKVFLNRSPKKKRFDAF